MMLRSSRLSLRPVLASDADALQAVFGDPQAMRYSRIGAQPAQYAASWIAHLSGERGLGTWAVADRANEQVIGYASLTALRPGDGGREAELMLRLAPAWWRRGYGSEAAQAVLDYGFDHLGLRRIVASIDPDHVAADAWLRKLGLRPAGELMLAGDPRPERLYAIERG
ncbi:GNAT family N-acetyltransferase [Lysobacter sp. BMK333-48F3]|uniref:GNAT family N-acetyltransferase n=1 Tax=Lysobacter sp. BMK333-48F3 TaxID=2867962 RepID=UPI001C8B3BF1|nr:GNAT family N-acetyltransferase [Lysobacter sp. BMK333-48F3]MBX9400285.1 GNAT family N-acetyltransferase [Lysobacter sp. BMK333-48F3]